MMEIGSFEAKNRLSELIRKVQEGERVMITYRGKPAAMLVSPFPEQKNASAAIDALMAFGERHALHLEKGETIRTLIEQGRR
jgi:prevent-host-death family protein